MESTSTSRHHHTLEVSVSTTEKHVPLYCWRWSMLTTGSESSKWGILVEPAMEECMLDLIWERVWRTPSTTLPGAAQLGDMSFIMVGDAAFPLKPYLRGGHSQGIPSCDGCVHPSQLSAFPQ